jgi:methenyltetrahydrofolate cyclohydrolase
MSDQLLDTPLGTFLDQLASGTPTPGGGSVAALTGAMAAGLITMVCDLTIGKKSYAEFEGEAQSIRARAEAARAELQSLAQADIAVFNSLSAAYKLPKTTEADAATRKAAIQKVLRDATDVPLRTALRHRRTQRQQRDHGARPSRRSDARAGRRGGGGTDARARAARELILRPG